MSGERRADGFGNTTFVDPFFGTAKEVNFTEQKIVFENDTTITPQTMQVVAAALVRSGVMTTASAMAAVGRAALAASKDARTLSQVINDMADIPPITPELGLEAILQEIEEIGPEEDFRAAAGAWMMKVSNAISELIKNREGDDG